MDDAMDDALECHELAADTASLLKVIRHRSGSSFRNELSCSPFELLSLDKLSTETPEIYWKRFVRLIQGLLSILSIEFLVDDTMDHGKVIAKIMHIFTNLGLDLSRIQVEKAKEGHGKAAYQMIHLLAIYLLEKKLAYGTSQPESSNSMTAFEVEYICRESPGTEPLQRKPATEKNQAGIRNRKNLRSTQVTPLGDTQDFDSQTNDQKWYNEVERAAQKLDRKFDNLKLTEWNNQLTYMQQMRLNRTGKLDAALHTIENYRREISETMNGVSNREAALNFFFKDLCQKYSAVIVKVEELQAQASQNSTELNELSCQIQMTSNDLAKLNGQMESYGRALVDESPLQTLQKSLSQLNQEIDMLAMRIEVTSSALASLQQRDTRLGSTFIHARLLCTQSISP